MLAQGASLKMTLLSFPNQAIKKILVISLSNIGDIILTFPVIDILKEDFPKAKLSVMVGPKGEALLSRNPFIDRVFIFNKKKSIQEKVLFIDLLRKEHFGLVVDLRNSAIPYLISARYKTSVFMKRLKNQHMRWQHLNRLKTVYPYTKDPQNRFSLYIPDEDKEYINEIINKNLQENKDYIVISPGAADQNKQWSLQGFAVLSEELTQRYKVQIVFVGDSHDTKIVQEITRKLSSPFFDLSGKTTLTQLAYLIKNCRLAIVNDSAPLHMASYLNVPVLALFGPTDPSKYGPWSCLSRVIRKNDQCRACQKQGGCLHECMQAITLEDVLEAVESLRVISGDSALFLKKGAVPIKT